MKDYKGLPNFIALRNYLQELEKKDWVVDDTRLRVDFDLTIVHEIVRQGGTPILFQIIIPKDFASAASAALRSLFPNIKPYTNLRPPVWNIRSNALSPGYYQCSDSVFVEVAYFSINLLLTFTMDINRSDPQEVYKQFMDKFRSFLGGRLIVLQRDNNVDEDEDSAAVLDGEERLVKHFGGAANILTFQEYLNSYPPNIQAALGRIVTMLEIVAQRPASGLHFSALLAGEPGTGKSLFAHYLAKDAMKSGVCVIYTVGNVGSMYLRTVIEFALQNIPAVLFILDECENSILSREYMSTETLHFFLQLLDGYTYKTYASWGIIFITNRPHMIDPALIRPERIEEVVEFSALDDGGLAYSVFVRWCEKLGISVPDGVDPAWFAKRTHAECAGIAHKLQRLSAFGSKITAKTIYDLLKEIARWTDTTKLKGMSKSRENMGFSS